MMMTCPRCRLAATGVVVVVAQAGGGRRPAHELWGQRRPRQPLRPGW
jgi:hypothetical protein